MSSTPIRWRSADRRTSTTELYYETCPLTDPVWGRSGSSAASGRVVQLDRREGDAKVS